MLSKQALATNAAIFLLQFHGKDPNNELVADGVPGPTLERILFQTMSDPESSLIRGALKIPFGATTIIHIRSLPDKPEEPAT